MHLFETVTSKNIESKTNSFRSAVVFVVVQHISFELLGEIFNNVFCNLDGFTCQPWYLG